MQEKAREKREELLERERRGIECEKEALAKEEFEVSFYHFIFNNLLLVKYLFLRTDIY